MHFVESLGKSTNEDNKRIKVAWGSTSTILWKPLLQNVPTIIATSIIYIFNLAAESKIYLYKTYADRAIEETKVSWKLEG